MGERIEALEHLIMSITEEITPLLPPDTQDALVRIWESYINKHVQEQDDG